MTFQAMHSDSSEEGRNHANFPAIPSLFAEIAPQSLPSGLKIAVSLEILSNGDTTFLRVIASGVHQCRNFCGLHVGCRKLGKHF